MPAAGSARSPSCRSILDWAAPVLWALPARNSPRRLLVSYPRLQARENRVVCVQMAETGRTLPYMAPHAVLCCRWVVRCRAGIRLEPIDFILPDCRRRRNAGAPGLHRFQEGLPLSAGRYLRECPSWAHGHAMNLEPLAPWNPPVEEGAERVGAEDEPERSESDVACSARGTAKTPGRRRRSPSNPIMNTSENDASGREPLGHRLSQHCPLRVNYLFFATFAARSSSWCYKQTGFEEP